MKQILRTGSVFAAFHKVQWRLTLSYFLVSLTAMFSLGWWGLAAGTIYLQRANPDLSWVEVISGQVLPALRVIFPSALLLIVPAALVGAYFGFLNARWLDQRLVNMRGAVSSWQAGDFSVVVDDAVNDEIGSFGKELNRMARELEHLLRAREELSALEERNQLARDLHDSVKQQITAASFQLSAAKALLEQNRGEAARSCLAEAENLALVAHQELNSIIFELRPVSLKPGGLTCSLREYVENWSRQTRVQVQAEIQEIPEVRLDTQEELMRFTQEALSNVARHSRATRVEVCLSLKDREIFLTIQDNGQGFDPSTLERPGFGLRTMRERMARCGGEFTIESSQQGTRITSWVPLDRES